MNKHPLIYERSVTLILVKIYLRVRAKKQSGEAVFASPVCLASTANRGAFGFVVALAEQQ